MGILDTAGSKLDLYSGGYETSMVETVKLLDAAGYLGRDDLRQAFEEADDSDEAAPASFRCSPTTSGRLPTLSGCRWTPGCARLSSLMSGVTMCLSVLGGAMSS